MIEAVYRGTRQAAPIDDVRADESVIIPDPARELGRFRVTRIYPMGLARSARSKSSFIDSVTDAVDDFYAQLLQKLKPWTPPAPKFRSKPEEKEAGDQMSSTDLSSMDDPEPAVVQQG